MRILTIFTGGTIGCAPPKADGSKDILKNNKPVLNKTWKDYFLIADYVKRYEKNALAKNIVFDTLEPMQTLSENMTIGKWNILLDVLKKIDFDKYDGIILTHGTDTLAYTSSMVGILLQHIKIPFIIVSSNEHLWHTQTNGHKNFEDAVNFICTKKYRGTFVFYSYDLSKTIVYLGTKIKQPQAFIDKYESVDGINFGYILDGKFFKNDDGNNIDNFLQKNPTDIKSENILLKIKELDNCVLLLTPYVGMDYSLYNLKSGIKAILHATYHSFTFCIENDSDKMLSIKEFNNQCKKFNIQLYISPFDSRLLKDNAAMYPSTKIMLQSGAKFITGVSLECSYAMLLIAYSIFDDIKQIEEFLENIFS